MNEIKPTSRTRAVTASHAAARALANDSLLSVVLRDNTTAVRLGMVESTDSNEWAISQSFVRAISDAVAVVETYHDASTHSSLSPASALRLRLFNEMEWIRCEAAGGTNLMGVASNLTYLWHKRHPAHAVTASPTATQTLSLLTRHALNLIVENTEALNNAKQMLPNDIRDNFLELPNHISDQPGYAAISLAIIESLEQLLQMMMLGTTAADEDDDTSVAIDAPDTNDEEQKKKEDTSEARESDEDPATPLLTDVINEHFEDDNDAHKDSAANALTDSVDTGTVEGEPYTSYSQSEDEVIHAREICTQKELVNYREKLDDHILLHKRVVGKLSGQLQRVLMAQQNRHWKFDLEQGALDTSRLTRIVTRPTSSLAFKQESESAFKDTVVTLLVDNSRSMDGMPIATAAACADILSQTLERCGVSVEILGFTTTELHGGKLFRDWKSEGRSAQPGRLNGLRHIIYKSADVPYRRARNEFGLMLNKDILKQNIDGESLLWAVKRLSIRPEARKILLVISDGAPLDSSTMSANRTNYLSDHLHKVIADIERGGQIELAAVGIGHDVSKYYHRAITIRDVRYLGKTLLAQLKSLFAATNGRRQAG